MLLCCRPHRVCLTNSRTQLTELQASVLSPAAAWRDNASLAGAELLISRKKPLAAGLLTELDTGRREAWNTGLRFTQLVAAAQRCVLTRAPLATITAALRCSQPPWCCMEALSVRSVCLHSIVTRAAG